VIDKDMEIVNSNAGLFSEDMTKCLEKLVSTSKLSSIKY
jgi:hypothetical protein